MTIRHSIETVLLKPIARGFDRIGFSPNMVTVLGLLVCLLGGVLLVWQDSGYLAFFLYLVGLLLDTIDGPLARLRGQGGERGRYLDSMADRVAEAIVYLSMAAWLSTTERVRAAGTVVIVYAVSSIGSYASAISASSVQRGRFDVTTRARRLLLTGVALLLFVGRANRFGEQILLFTIVATMASIGSRVWQTAKALERVGTESR